MRAGSQVPEAQFFSCQAFSVRGASVIATVATLIADTSLDAGAALTLNGPNGKRLDLRSLRSPTSPPTSYYGSVGVPSESTPPFFGPGIWQLNAPGGHDIRD